MASLKGLVGELVGRLLFREVEVARVQDLSPHFRRVELRGADLRGASYAVGDKLQVVLDGFETRTYTPFGFDAAAGVVQLLLFSHGDGPGSAWTRRVAVGDRLRVFGPRGSLPLGSLPGPVVLFGDETSFAVAHALTSARGAGAADVRCVFEVGERGEAERVLAALDAAARGLDGPAIDSPAVTLVERAAADAHLPRAAEALRAALAAVASSGRHPAHLVLTGRAQSIQAIRQALRTAPAGQKVKAYWAVGKRGLD